jgi:tetratricopeptide (TPR) repeat protein
MNSARITLYGFLVVLILSAPVTKQQDKVNSLHDRLTNQPLSDTTRVKTLNKISAAFLVTRNRDSVDAYAWKALSNAKAINYGPGVFSAYLTLGLCQMDLGAYSQAEKYLLRALATYDSMPVKGESLQQCYMQLGLATWAQSKFDKSVTAYLKAKKLALASRDFRSLSKLYVALSALESQRGHYKSSIDYAMNGLPLWRNPVTFSPSGFCAIAFIYNSFGDYESSLQYYREAVKLRKLHPVADGAAIDIFMGETYFLARKYDSAHYCYNRIFEHLAKPRSEYWFDSRMAELQIIEGHVGEAIDKLNRSLRGFRSTDDTNQVMWVLSRLMQAHRLNHDSRSAMNVAYELLRISSATGARQHERDANYLLSGLYDQQHNADSAIKYLKQYNYFKDVIDSDQAQQRLSIFKSRFELGQLRASLEKHEFQLQQAKTQRIYFSIAILMISAIGLIAFRNVSLRRKTEHQRLASVQNELLLQKLEGEATKATLQQRASDLEMQALRAQMNPHFIFNSLNSINRYILTNDRVLASEYLTTFSKLIRLILSNSRAPLITLESELEGLALYLKLESLRFENRFEYNISLPADLEPSELKIPPLILQPYVENAIWHGLMHKADPGYLEITIRRKREFIYINISDNGIGRKHAAALSSKSATRNKSLGLKITAERIAHMFGDQSANVPITINDLANPDGTAAGTEVIVKIPVIYD